MPPSRSVASALLAVLLLAGPAGAETAALGAHGLVLPGSFSGTLPAGGGPGVSLQLDLWPDQVFQLRRTWLAQGTREDLLGRWHVDPERRALILEGGQAPSTRFGIMGDGTLRPLDEAGAAGGGAVSGTLARAEAFSPFAPDLPLRGMFLYFADSARFTECRSGRSWPVAMEGDFLALQAAWLATRPPPPPDALPEPLLARIEATVAQRPRMEGEGTQATVIVRRFLSLHPSERCDRPAAEATLRNTYWRILTLGGERVGTEAGQREPYLLLHLNEPRFSATVGCNQLLGEVETAGATLRFTPGPTTMMACPAPLDAREQALAAALAGTAAFQLEGTSLTLRGADARPLATLEAVYLR